MDVSGNTFVCKYLSSLGTIVDQFTITKVVTQARESKSEYKIYQSEERIVLDVATDEPSLADLSFYSIDGKIMQQFTSLELNPQSKLYFSKGTFSMPTGIYIAVLTSNKQRYSQKLFLNF